MDIPIVIVDENGGFKKLIVSPDMLSGLVKMMRVGPTDIHAQGDDGTPKLYKAHALLMVAKGFKGKFMYLPEEYEVL